MKKVVFGIFFVGVIGLFLSACDLQPKIMALPDTVGDFISARYPALLADPNSQSDIYNSAASDYGVYAAPELYGSDGMDEYVLYASVDDYIIPPQDVGENVTVVDAKDIDSGNAVIEEDTEVISASGEEYFVAETVVVDDWLSVPMYGGASETKQKEITVVAGDTLYSLARQHGMAVEELAKINDIHTPYSIRVGQKLKVLENINSVISVPEKVVVVKKDKEQTNKAIVTNTTTRVELKDVVVAPGETLYALSRKYSVPVNDLAVLNNLSAPFALRSGQTLKVPMLDSQNVKPVSVNLKKETVKNVVVTKTDFAVSGKTVVAKQNVQNQKNAKKGENAGVKKENEKQEVVKKQETKSKEKISSDPKKKLPEKITKRSSSKFSWPLKGRVLSEYGAKKGGLFNDGINIGAVRGSPVKAAENGVVAYAGNEVKGMGNLVIIQHADGWMTVYSHLESMSVRRGTRVTVGQKIGSVGTTGKVTKPQLHFEIRKGTRAYDPMSYLKK